MIWLSLTLGCLGNAAHAQAIPAAIVGAWKIVKVLPTHNVGCWDAERAGKLVGWMLLYRPRSMEWQGGTVAVPETVTRVLSRRKFMEEYKVDLGELGIAAASVQEFDLQHEDADVTGATTEVPGDTVVVAGPGKIVVSACGVFFLAVRVPAGGVR